MWPDQLAWLASVAVWRRFQEVVDFAVKTISCHAERGAARPFLFMCIPHPAGISRPTHACILFVRSIDQLTHFS
jgi:hypothetical protein